MRLGAASNRLDPYIQLAGADYRPGCSGVRGTRHAAGVG